MTYEEECEKLREWFTEESTRIDEISFSGGLDGPHACAVRELVREMGRKGQAIKQKYGIE